MPDAIPLTAPLSEVTKGIDRWVDKVSSRVSGEPSKALDRSYGGGGGGGLMAGGT